MLNMNRLAHACILVVLASLLKRSDHLFIDDLLHAMFKRANRSASRVEVILCIPRTDCYPSAERARPRTLARVDITSVPNRPRSARGLVAPERRRPLARFRFSVVSGRHLLFAPRAASEP
jgi:hypothetical protein